MTTWNYDAYRGWLSSKVYAGNQPGPGYTYTPAGRMESRTWARGITTSYGYNGAGELALVDYSDATPDVSFGYNRRGQQTAVTANGVLARTRGLADNNSSSSLRNAIPSE